MEVSSLGSEIRYQRVLWLTVVEQAIRDTMEPKPKVRRTALEWLLYDTEDFPEICYLAGIESGYLRKLMAARLPMRGF